MPQTGTANLVDFEPGNASATASLDEFQPELLPEVKQAIAAVPRPRLPYMQTEFAPTALANKDVTAGEVFPHDVPLTPEAKAAQAAKGAAFGEDLSQQARAATKELSEHPREAILNVGMPGAGTIAHGAKGLATPGHRAEGALNVATGLNDMLSPAIGPAAIENPGSILRGFGEGFAASKAAGYLAKKSGATQEQQDAIEQLAQFAPMTAHALAESLGLSKPKLAVTSTDQGTGVRISGQGGTGAGVAVTPEGIHIGGQFKGGQPRSVTILRNQPQAQPAIEPPTIEGQVAPPPANPHPGAPADNVAEAASAIGRMQEEEAQAMRVVSGLPPTPPPPQPPPAPPVQAPPIPPEIANGHISPETVQKIGAAIAQVPTEFRAQATLEAHQTLSQSILQQGKVITPDGTLEIVTKPERADKVAQRIINDEVKRQEKIIAEQTNESGQVGVGVATTETAPLSKIEQALRARRARKVDQEQATPIAPAPVVPRVEQPEEPQGNNIGTATLHEFTPQTSSPAVPPKTEGGTAALADLAPTNFLKGDRVVLPDGAKAKVSWVSQKMSIVRVKTDDGQVLSIGARKLKSVQPEPVTPSGWMAERESVPARPISQLGKSSGQVLAAEPKPEQPLRNNNSTQINLPGEVASKIKAVGQSIIPDKDLAQSEGSDSIAAKRREAQPHITVKYGVNDRAAEVLRERLAEHPPFEATLGKIRTFPPTENSAGAAVAHAEVNSPELKKLHAEIDKHVGSKKDDFEYKPHVTLAYIRPEVAHKYEGRSDLEGTKIPVNAITVSQKDGKQVDVPLGGKGASAEKTSGLQPEKATHLNAVEGDRKAILQSEIADLKRQREAVTAEYSSKGTYSPERAELANKSNEILKKVRAREDEIARLNGEPTHNEKQEIRQKEAEKPFEQRPPKALKYSQTEQSQHWQVLEPDYIEKRFAEKVRSYEKAVPEKQAEVAKLKPGTNKYITEESNLKYWKDLLKKYRERDPRQAQTFKNEYTELVKKAVSQGRPVPDEVIDQNSEFTLAKSARERYEKGRHTSFANRSAAINDTMQKEEGFKVKRQDGKPIPEDQAKEISDGVSDIVEVLGPALRDMMRGTDLTIAHTNGRHPFLSDAAGQYHPVDRSISAGVKDFLGRPVHALAHELGHWMDYEAGRVLGVRHHMLTKSGPRSPEAKFVSEADAQKDQFAALGKARQDLYTLARNSMTDTREVSRMLKLTKMSDLPDAERAEVERVKVVLGHYWKDPRELWARMFEQYIADKLGRESMATETIERYLKAPAWWDKEAWAKLKPMVEQEIAKRMDALRERYAPTTESTEPFASRPAAVEATPSSEDAKSIAQRAPVAGQQGSDTTLNTANGNLSAKYRVVEAADLLPSHNPQTFGRNPDYPGGIQERTYDTSKEAQARVIQQAQNYDPNYTINTNPDAVNGPPIITPDGTVLGGNSRAMSTQRLYKSGKGELYKDALIAQAQTFGLDKEAIRLMKEPVLVREVAHPESLEATRRLASDLNKSMTGTLGVSERAVSAGKSITRDSLAKVAAMMDDIGADASLRDLMRERGRDLVSLLVKDGVITERERPQFVETATGGLSEEGKTFVERALLGSVVDDPRLMDSTPKAVLNKLDGSLAALSSLSPRTDPYNILPLVRAALHDHAEIASLGSNVETFLNQSGLFGGDRSPAVDAMTRLLAERPTVVKQKFRQFAQDAGFDVQGQATLGLMEAVGPVKAFNDAFGTNLTEEALADSIVRAAQIDPIIGGSREAGIPGSTETSARGVQQRRAGEARPGSEAGAGAPTQGKSQPKTGNQLDLLADESGSFEPGKLAAPVAELFKQDVAPALGKAGVGLRDTAALFIKALYPRIEESNPVGRWLKAAAPSDAVDELMRLKGDRAKALANFDGVMSGMEKMFDHLPEEARIDFIHRIQIGEKQPSTELQQIANLFKQVQDIERSAEQDAMNLGRKGKAVELSRKENYFHNWWSTPPGTDVAEDEETRVSRLSSPRRPLEGSRGYNKRQSYTLKEGIAAGGKPETTNPVRIMRHRIEDGLKFVTARKAWQGLHDLDLRTFVGQGERPPAGFDKVDDRIARVYFPAESGEGTIKAGEWYVEANTARLLNNMLGRDLIRGNAAGRSLMWLKNASTALELGLSPFHAVFETIEAASSQLALGMQRSFNLGIRGGDPTALAKGIYEMATSPVAPITMAREGAALPAYIEARSRLGEIGITQFGKHQIEGTQPHGIKEAIAHFGEVRKVAGIRRLLLQYPDLDQLVDDMFTGGLIIGQHRDYQTRAFGKTAAEAWSAGNHLGAMLRAAIGLPQTMMKPLFQWYIPNLKYSLFLKQMSEQAAEHAAELEDGSLTRATLARRVADSVENRFGELNFDNLFLDRTVKTALQFMFRSVTYKLGTAREFAGAAGGQTTEWASWARQAYDSEYRESAEAPGALPRLDMRASWVAALMLTTVAMGAIASKLLSGKYPWEYLEGDNKEGSGDLRHLYLETVHPRTGEMDSRGKPVRISLPTYWKDVEHASSNPSQYVLSSLSTTLSKGMDLAENRDYFGNYVYNPNASLSRKIEQAGKYAFPTPFAVSNYQRGQQMGEPKTAWLSAFGFPRAPSNLDFTPAERLAQSLLKAREAPHTPEEMEAWSEKRQAFEKGQLSPAAARSFVKQQRESYLERQFKHLQYTEAVRVYGVATQQEKPLLNRLLREKRQNLVRRHATIPPGSD